VNNFGVVIFIAQFDEISVVRSLAGMSMLIVPCGFRRPLRNSIPWDRCAGFTASGRRDEGKTQNGYAETIQRPE
jgi:hypothetical protein